LKPQGELQYFQKRSGQEIDFIFNGNTAIEVKETPLERDLNSLRSRAGVLQLERQLLIGRTPAASGFTDFIWAGSIY
jgi:hypothetical protein